MFYYCCFFFGAVDVPRLRIKKEIGLIIAHAEKRRTDRWFGIMRKMKRMNFNLGKRKNVCLQRNN